MERSLTRRDKKQISQWIGNDSQFELLYKISRDGGSAETFRVTTMCTGSTCQTAGRVPETGVQTRERFCSNYILLATGSLLSSHT